MEEPVQKWKVPHRHPFTWVLAAMVVGLGWYAWSVNVEAAKSIAHLEQQVRTLRAQTKVLADKPEAERPTTVWSMAVAKVPLCGEWVTNKAYGVPNETVLKELGFGDILNEGYAFRDICADIGDGRLAYIAVRKDAEAGEQDLLGTADLDTGRLAYIRSKHVLAILAEPPYYCRADGVVAGDTSAEDRMLIYCGSESKGGLTHWYAYDLKDDKLTLAQEYTGIPNDEYRVVEGAIQEKFHIKRRP